MDKYCDVTDHQNVWQISGYAEDHGISIAVAELKTGGDKSALVQVIAWCCQATSQHLNYFFFFFFFLGGGRQKHLWALKISTLYKIISFNVWARYFLLNFKDFLWEIFEIQQKISYQSGGEPDRDEAAYCGYKSP